MASQNEFQRFLEYSWVLAKRWVAIVGFLLAGLGSWAFRWLGWDIPSFLVPVIGACIILLAGYQVYSERDRRNQSSIRNLTDRVQNLESELRERDQNRPDVVVSMASNGQPVHRTEVSYRAPIAADIDKIVADQNSELQGEIQSDYERSVSINSSIIIMGSTSPDDRRTANLRKASEYLKELRAALQLQQCQRELNSRWVDVKLLTANRGPSAADSIRLELSVAKGAHLPNEHERELHEQDLMFPERPELAPRFTLDRILSLPTRFDYLSLGTKLPEFETVFDVVRGPHYERDQTSASYEIKRLVPGYTERDLKPLSLIMDDFTDQAEIVLNVRIFAHEEPRNPSQQLIITASRR